MHAKVAEQLPGAADVRRIEVADEYDGQPLLEWPVRWSVLEVTD